MNIKGRKFEIKKYFEGISRFNFDELCDRNLGAEDYLEISKNLINLSLKFYLSIAHGDIFINLLTDQCLKE